MQKKRKYLRSPNYGPARYKFVPGRGFSKGMIMQIFALMSAVKP
jgi:hypothetical protein